VLDRNSYIEKNHTNIISDNISHNISDPNTYTKLVKNPLNKLSRNVQELLKKKWKKKNYISESTYKKLATIMIGFYQEHTHYRRYIHKEGIPLRIIISSLDSFIFLGFILNEISEISKNVNRLSK